MSVARPRCAGSRVTDLIYIGGYGRSGSTLLETLLATRGDVLACGEIVSCLHERKERPCTCGKSRYECAVWSPFYKNRQSLRGLTHEDLTSALLDNASKDYGFVVDSSKTAWGSLTAPFKLRRRLGGKFHLVHVVRDPKGVCWSNVGGVWQRRRALAKSVTLRHLKTLAGWWAANLSSEIFGRVYPRQYHRIRYEDLCRAQAESLERLFAALPQRDGGSRAADTSADNRHQLFGNQARHKEVNPSEIREDTRWKAEMPVSQQKMVSLLAWPLRNRYGY